MSAILPAPTHPTIATETDLLVYGDGGISFADSLDVKLAAIEAKIQLSQAFWEVMAEQLGFGLISGGIATAGTGLSVNISTIKAIVGSYVEFNAPEVVALSPSQTNRVWLRQGGSPQWTVKTDNTVPTDISFKGRYLKICTAVTNSTGVTSIINHLPGFRFNSGGGQVLPCAERTASGEATLLETDPEWLYYSLDDNLTLYTPVNPQTGRSYWIYNVSGDYAITIDDGSTSYEIDPEQHAHLHFTGQAWRVKVYTH